MKLWQSCKVLLNLLFGRWSTLMQSHAWVCPLVDVAPVISCLIYMIQWHQWVFLERSTEILRRALVETEQSHPETSQRKKWKWWSVLLDEYFLQHPERPEVLQMMGWGTKGILKAQCEVQAVVESLSKAWPCGFLVSVLLVSNTCFEADMLGVSALKDFLWNFSQMLPFFVVVSVLNCWKLQMYKGSCMSHHLTLN